MYQIPSKRRQLMKRVLVYTIMTLGVIAVVITLVFVMLGYRFNRTTSTLEQGGLVQFASRPTDASVKIGSATLTDTTPSKITVNPGNYGVTMNRAGYKQWQKDVSVKAGQVLWLNYAQMTPNTIETKQVDDISALTSVKSSPNGDRFAVIEDATKPVITFIDVTSEKPKLTTVTLPTTLFRSGQSAAVTLGDWANDSDRIVVNATYGTETEYLVADRRDADKAYNVSTKYTKDILEIVFDPRNSERLITRSANGDVRTINSSDDTLSGIIATSVSSMSLYGNDAIIFVQTVADGEQAVSYASLGSDTVKTLRKIASKERVLAAAAEYFSEPHLAVATGSELEIFKVASLPSSESDASISMSSLSSQTLPAPADFLTIRSGGRFVFAQFAGGALTHDLELEKSTVTTFNQPVSGEIRWLDRYHFYLTNGSNLEVMEFDGGNPQVITPLTTQFDAVQSDDGTFIYSINAAEKGFTIQQSRMILKG